MSSLLIETESRNGPSEPESQNGPSPSVDLKTEPHLTDRRTDPSAIDESLPINAPVEGNSQPSSLVAVEEKEESEHREAVASPAPSNAPPTSEAAAEGDQKPEEFGTAPPTSGSGSNGPSEISPVEQPTSEAAAVGDQKSYKSGTAPTSDNGSNAPPEISPAEQTTQPEPRNEEEARTITMRDLLNGFKDDESSRPDMESPDSERSSQQQQYQHPDQDNTAMDLIGSVTGIDEEGRSRQRILTYAARRYASAVERNPGDYDALYNWALVLQESADNVDPDSTSPSKDALLEEACKKYEEATRLCPTLNDAYYNWAIAISDRARMRGRTKEAEELWKQATQHYEKAVQLNWNSPQALNNWGLALQELSAIVPAKEKQTIVRTAINKFRAAIQLQFDFHRAIYNLGTVLYGLAEDTLRVGATGIKETSANELYSQCAIYIAAAHALKPNYSVYRSALKLVRSMLPLPYLKVGYMTAAPPGSPISPHKEWKRTQFVLNHEGLYQLIADEQRQMRRSLSGNTIDAQNGKRQSVKVEIADIVSVSACADLTLPPGAGLSIDTIHGPIYLVADSWESLDGWLDAIRLVYTIFARGKSEVLAGIITG